MKKIIFALLFAVSFAAMLFVQTGCVKEDFDTVPVLDNVPTWTKSVSIQEVRNLLSGDASIIKDRANATNLWATLASRGITDSSIVFEGTIISCDSAGNFYKTVTIMDETTGIDLKVADKNLYVVYGFKPGQKVLVRVNEMAISNYKGMIQIGIPITDYDGSTALDISGVPVANMDKVVQLSGRRGTVEAEKIRIDNIPSTCVQRLVTIDSVQFRGGKLTFTNNGVTTNRYVVNADNYSLIVRTSAYATYGSDTLPSGNGSITGVMGVYNSTYQLFIRDLNDIKFNGEEFPDEVPTANTTIAALKAMCTSNLVQITNNVVIKGVINGNDAAGNIYKQLYIEDETGGIMFGVDVSGLSSSYPVGTNVAIRCKNLYVGKYGGIVQLGGLYNGGIGRVSEADFARSIYITDGTATVNVIETTISGLSTSMVGRVVKFPAVQFIDSDLGNVYAESNTTNRTLTDAEGNTILVRTSAYADFAGSQLPEGSGTFTAVLGKYYNDYQLYIRDINEVQLTEARFEVTGPVVPTPNTTIAELKAMYASSLLEITGDVVIEGTVISSDVTGNIYKKLYIDDGTAGLPISVGGTSLYNNYPIGSKVVINCKGMFLGTSYGVVMLGGQNGSYVGWCTDYESRFFVTETNLTVTPITTTINAIDNSMIGRLLKLENVEFQTTGVTYSDGNTYTTHVIVDAGGNTVNMKVSKYASFKNNTVPTGSGSMVAILSLYNGSYELWLSSTEDVSMTGDYFKK